MLFLLLLIHFTQYDNLQVHLLPLLLLLLLLSRFSRVRLLVTPWTSAHQGPLSMGFSRQEYWSGLPLLSQKQVLLMFKKFFKNSLLCIQRYFSVCKHQNFHDDNVDSYPKSISQQIGFSGNVMWEQFINAKPDAFLAQSYTILCHVMDLLVSFEDCQQVSHRMTHSKEHAKQSFEIRIG